MRTDAARMRRWTLWGAPGLMLLAPGVHAGGVAAGLMLWLLMGAYLLPRTAYAYPRRRGMRPRRLFLAFGAGCFALCAGFRGAQFLYTRFTAEMPLYNLLALEGAVPLAIVACARALFWFLPPRICWGAGALFCALSVPLIVYR